MVSKTVTFFVTLSADGYCLRQNDLSWTILIRITSILKIKERMIMVRIVIPCLLTLALSYLGIRFPVYRVIAYQNLEGRGGVRYVKGDEKPFTGMAFLCYEDGSNSQESPYIKGKLNGTEINYYENGSKQGETPYLNGKKHGTQIWYFEDGSKREEFVYENGKQISRKKF